MDILGGGRLSALVRSDSVHKRELSEREKKKSARFVRTVLVKTRAFWFFLRMPTLICVFFLISLTVCIDYRTIQIGRIGNTGERQRGLSCYDTSKSAPVNFAREILQQSPVTMQPLIIAFRLEVPGTWRARIDPFTPLRVHVTHF